MSDASGAAIVAKTGMGSSAALVTSLVGCLASFLRVATLPGGGKTDGGSDVAACGGGCEADVDRSVRLVHHVAQVAHALAQGKVGSGFDVSSAALGSQRYIRVPAETLKGYLDRLDTEDDAKVAAVAAELAASRVADWDYQVVRCLCRCRCVGRVCVTLLVVAPPVLCCVVPQTPFALPRGFELMMADVCGGSETPSMVRKVRHFCFCFRGCGVAPTCIALGSRSRVARAVGYPVQILAWKKAGEGGAADELWAKLGKINDEVENAFAQLRSLADEDTAAYDAALLECASTTGDKVRGVCHARHLCHAHGVALVCVRVCGSVGSRRSDIESGRSTCTTPCSIQSYARLPEVRIAQCCAVLCCRCAKLSG